MPACNAFVSSIFFGTQIRPSLRKDSDINVSFDCFVAVNGDTSEFEHKQDLQNMHLYDNIV